MWSRSHSQDLRLAFPAGQPHRLARQPSLTSGEGRADGVLVRLPRRGARSGGGFVQEARFGLGLRGSGQFKFCEPGEDLKKDNSLV